MATPRQRERVASGPPRKAVWIFALRPWQIAMAPA